MCIAVQTSALCKSWNYPFKCREVVRVLTGAGYRVIGIGQNSLPGQRQGWTYIANGALDGTEDRPTTGRGTRLRHAVFFIKTSSAIFWLARAFVFRLC